MKMLILHEDGKCVTHFFYFPNYDVKNGEVACMGAIPHSLADGVGSLHVINMITDDPDNIYPFLDKLK